MTISPIFGTQTLRSVLCLVHKHYDQPYVWYTNITISPMSGTQTLRSVLYLVQCLCTKHRTDRNVYVSDIGLIVMCMYQT
jgi:hypothetical protein